MIPTPADPRLIAATRLSRTLSCLLGVVVLLVPPSVIAYAVLWSEQLAHHPWLGEQIIPATPWPALWAWLAAVVLLLHAAPMLWAIDGARRMFRRFSEGAFFTEATPRYLGRIAQGLLLTAITQSVASAAFSAVAAAAHGIRQMSVTLTSDQIWLALLGLTMLGIARVMRVAVLVAEDNAAII